MKASVPGDSYPFICCATGDSAEIVKNCNNGSTMTHVAISYHGHVRVGIPTSQVSHEKLGRSTGSFKALEHVEIMRRRKGDNSHETNLNLIECII